MDFRVLSLLLIAGIFFAFGLLVYFSGRRSVINRVYCIFIANMTLWAFSLAMFYTLEGPATSLFWSKVVYLAGSIIPAAFLHFSFVFPKGAFRPWQLAIYFPNVALFVLYFFTPWILHGVDYFDGAKGFLYGPCRILWDLQFDTMFALGFYRLLRSYKRSAGVMKMRLRYVVLGTFVGLVLAGATNVIMPWFNRFQLLWLGPPLTLTWLGSIVYAITRYNLMDIRVAVARVTIFVLLHTLAIGAPFFIAISGEAWLESLVGEKWWMVPFGLLAGLSSLVPLLYRLLQTHTEARIFRAERQYQAALRTMSQELIGFTDTEQVSEFVGSYVGTQMQLTSAQLLVQVNGLGFLPAGQRPDAFSETLQRWYSVPGRTNTIILAEESTQAPADPELRAIRTWMRRVGLSAIMPGCLRGELITCLLLGLKQTGEMFSSEDYEVLGALTRQGALVIKNLQLYEEVAEQKRRAIEEAAERKRLAQLGELSLAVSHEFNNLLGDLLQPLVEMAKQFHTPAALPPLVEEMQTLITRRGRCITTAASAYKNKCTSPLQTHSLALVVTEAFTQAQKTKFAGSEAEITLTHSIDPTLVLEGNATLPQLFLNLLYCLGWACEDKHEQGTLTIEATQEDQGRVSIRLAMRGGSDPTTAMTHEGLAEEFGKHGGLYLVIARMIVNDHQGELVMDTTTGGGTTFTIRLPQHQSDDSPLRRPLPQTSIF